MKIGSLCLTVNTPHFSETGMEITIDGNVTNSNDHHTIVISVFNLLTIVFEVQTFNDLHSRPNPCDNQYNTEIQIPSGFCSKGKH